MLDDLYAGALADAGARRDALPFAAVEAAALGRAPALDARAFLAPAAGVKIIAEVKRASPSRGDLHAIPDPASLALSYATGGASAISVLTEGRKFKGSLADLEAVRAVVDVPVLRGDATKLRQATGWRPEIPLDETLLDVLAFWREQPPAG